MGRRDHTQLCPSRPPWVPLPECSPGTLLPEVRDCSLLHSIMTVSLACQGSQQVLELPTHLETGLQRHSFSLESSGELYSLAFYLHEPMSPKAQWHSVHKGAKTASKGSLCIMPCLPHWVALMCTHLWYMSSMSCERINPVPCTVWTFEVALPTRCKGSFFTNNQGLQLVTAKATIWSLSKGAHSFCFHFLLSLQPLDSCREHMYIKPPQSCAEGVRAHTLKVHKNIQFTHSCIYLSLQQLSSSVYIKYSSSERLLLLKQHSGIFRGYGEVVKWGDSQTAQCCVTEHWEALVIRTGYPEQLRMPTGDRRSVKRLAYGIMENKVSGPLYQLLSMSPDSW